MKNTTTFDSTSDDYLIITSPFKKEKWINFLFLGIDDTCYCYLWRISSIIRAKDAPTCCTYTRQV